MDEGITRPTIEIVLERIESLRTETRGGFESLRAEMQRIESENAANNRALRRVFDHLAGEIVQVKVAQDYIEEQIKKPA